MTRWPPLRLSALSLSRLIFRMAKIFLFIAIVLAIIINIIISMMLKKMFFLLLLLYLERERARERALNTAGCLLVVWIRIDQLEELSQLTFSSVLKIVVGPLLRAWIKLHALLAYAL